MQPVPPPPLTQAWQAEEQLVQRSAQAMPPMFSMQLQHSLEHDAATVGSERTSARIIVGIAEDAIRFCVRCSRRHQPFSVSSSHSSCSRSVNTFR